MTSNCNVRIFWLLITCCHCKGVVAKWRHNEFQALFWQNQRKVWVIVYSLQYCNDMAKVEKSREDSNLDYRLPDIELINTFLVT